MSQNYVTLDSGDDGETYSDKLQGNLNAVTTSHKGASVPSYVTAGMLWIDDSADPTWTYYFYDGTDSIEVGSFNTTTNVFTPANTVRKDFSNVYAADVSVSANTITVNPSLGLSAYATGMMIITKLANTIVSGAVTINVDSLGAKTCKKWHDATIQPYDYTAGQIVILVYDGTNFQIISTADMEFLIKGLSGATTLQSGDRFMLADDSNADKLASITASLLLTELIGILTSKGTLTGNELIGVRDVDNSNVGAYCTTQQIANLASSPITDIYESPSGLSITSSSSHTINHAKGALPVAFTYYCKCTTANGAFAVDDIVFPQSSSVSNKGADIVVDPTDTANIEFVFGSDSAVFSAKPPGGGAPQNLVNSSWEVYVVLFF